MVTADVSRNISMMVWLRSLRAPKTVAHSVSLLVLSERLVHARLLAECLQPQSASPDCPSRNVLWSDEV